MFAYCGNSPVARADATGQYYCKISFDAFSPFDTLLVNITGSSGGGSGFVGGNAVAAAVRSDPVYKYVTNTSEQVVIDAKYVAFYHGELVIKLPIGDAAAFYGVMFIGDKVTNADDIRHEYGHSRQWRIMGASAYTIKVAIPSVTINRLNAQGKLPYDYYTYPWEAQANVLGGSSNSQYWKDPLPSGTYTSYWDLIKLFF